MLTTHTQLSQFGLPVRLQQLRNLVRHPRRRFRSTGLGQPLHDVISKNTSRSNDSMKHIHNSIDTIFLQLNHQFV